MFIVPNHVETCPCQVPLCRHIHCYVQEYCCCSLFLVCVDSYISYCAEKGYLNVLHILHNTEVFDSVKQV